MHEYRNPRHLAALSLFMCACTPKVDLGEIESDTEAVDGSGTEGDTAEDSTGTTDGESGQDTGDPDTGDNPPMPGVGPQAVDVLFVIDNSGSMGEEQAALSASIEGFVAALDNSGLNYRIGVTTTDNGNYWCRGSGVSNPEAGNLVFSSCRSRLDDFYFITDGTDQTTACTDYCAIDQLAPTNGVPWIDHNGANLPVGVPVADALKCVLPQGINGCGFESHLESLDLAIRRATTETGEDELGFIREDAHLMIILVSDELDCSANGDWESIFYSEQEGGNEVFWSLPEENSPTSAVCWNAGVACTGDPSVYDECHPENYDVNRNPTTDPAAAVLFPLSRYQDRIDALTASKAASHAQVFVFGILGVPQDYPSSRTVVYAQGPNGNDPNSFQAKFGIGEGCTSSSGVAVPPVRMRTLIEDNAKTNASPLYSICAPSYGPALDAMVQQVTAFVGP